MESGCHVDLSWECLSLPLRVDKVVWDPLPPPRMCRGLYQEDGDDGSLWWFLGKESLWRTWTTASSVKLLPSNFIPAVGTTLTNLYLWDPVANQKGSVRKGTAVDRVSALWTWLWRSHLCYIILENGQAEFLCVWHMECNGSLLLEGILVACIFTLWRQKCYETDCKEIGSWKVDMSGKFPISERAVWGTPGEEMELRFASTAHLSGWGADSLAPCSQQVHSCSNLFCM